MFGWLAGPIALLPGWTLGTSAEADEERENRRDQAILELARLVADFLGDRAGP